MIWAQGVPIWGGGPISRGHHVTSVCLDVRYGERYTTGDSAVILSPNMTTITILDDDGKLSVASQLASATSSCDFKVKRQADGIKTPKERHL